MRLGVASVIRWMRGTASRRPVTASVRVALSDVPDAAPPSPRPARYQVVGIGNALVDVIAHAS